MKPMFAISKCWKSHEVNIDRKAADNALAINCGRKAEDVEITKKCLCLKQKCMVRAVAHPIRLLSGWESNSNLEESQNGFRRAR